MQQQHLGWGSRANHRARCFFPCCSKSSARIPRDRGDRVLPRAQGLPVASTSKTTPRPRRPSRPASAARVSRRLAGTMPGHAVLGRWLSRVSDPDQTSSRIERMGQRCGPSAVENSASRRPAAAVGLRVGRAELPGKFGSYRTDEQVCMPWGALEDQYWSTRGSVVESGKRSCRR